MIHSASARTLKVMAGDGRIDGAALYAWLKTRKIALNSVETFSGIHGGLWRAGSMTLEESSLNGMDHAEDLKHFPNLAAFAGLSHYCASFLFSHFLHVEPQIFIEIFNSLCFSGSGSSLIAATPETHCGR